MKSIYIFTALLLATPAMAQQTPTAQQAQPQKPTAGVEPTSTTASFGDWVLRCQKVEGAAVTRLCEVAQSLMVKGQSAPVAQIAMGRSSPLGDKPEQAMALAWKRCLPMGCFADVELTDDLMKRLRASAEGPRLGFTDGAGRDLALPFSLSGLPQALDALAKEPLGG